MVETGKKNYSNKANFNYLLFYLILMTKPQEYTAIFENKEVYNEKFEHYHFELKKPHTIEFQAGQFASFVVSEKRLRRSYSICSDPDIKHGIELLLDMTPNGVGINYMKSLKFGDEVKFLAPLGNFIITDEQPYQALVLVGTGSGIAPLRSMVLDQLQNKQTTRPITLYWGLRHASQLIWQNEFMELSKTFPNFSFHPTMSQPEAQWPLCRGRVTDCLAIHDLPANAGYYLCGSRAMIEDSTKVLQTRGVDPKNIYHEQFA